MRSILISDIHLATRLPHAKILPEHNGVTDRLMDIVAIIRQVADVAQADDIEHIFVLGDLFDKTHPSAPTMIQAAKCIRALAKHAHVWLLPGNHTAHDQVGGCYTLEQYDALEVPNVTVVRTSNRILVDPVNGVEFYAVPWVPEETFIEWVNVLKPHRDSTPDRSVLFMHQTVDGADDDGMLRSPLKGKHLTGWDLVLSGHIHASQPIKNGKEVIGQYLGAPAMLRFGDGPPETCPRGFWLLDHDTLAMELVETHSPVLRIWDFGSEDPKVFKNAKLPSTSRSLFQEVSARVDDLADQLQDDLDRCGAVYLRIDIRGGRDHINRAKGAIDAYVPDDDRLRKVIWNRQVIDEGASERVRKAVVTPGRLATPKELMHAYVEASDEDEDRRRELVAYAEGFFR